MSIVDEIFGKDKLKYKTLEKASKGFTSEVYLTENFVIKIADKDKSGKIKKEISFYKSVQRPYMPKYISSGEYKNKTYLIISRVRGDSLYSIWDRLKNDKREKIVKQISSILSDFNSIEGSFLDKEFRKQPFKSFIKKELENRKKEIEELGLDTSFLSEFVDENLFGLFDKNRYALVYNDAHFDNFLLDGDNLYLIDFDRVIFAPIDYELLIFKLMVDNPQKFASEEDEEKVKKADYKNVYTWLKKYYPKMFEIPKIGSRVKVYQFDYLAKQYARLKNKSQGKKLLRKLLAEFEENIKLGGE